MRTIPPTGGTRALLQSSVPSLVPSEQRVLRVCIDETEQVVNMSVAELAHRAGVSPATVVRACQRLGFGGFQSLRELLIRDQGARSAMTAPGLFDTASEGDRDRVSAPEDRARSRQAHTAVEVFRRAIQGIEGALGALDFAAFDAAASAIRGCGRLLVVGNGASLAAAQSVALHFLGSGKVCESPVDIVTQHVAAKLLRSGDVCLAVSDSGMNTFTLRSARLARENGATVVAITSYARSELDLIGTYSLIAGAGFQSLNNSAVTANIVQVLLLSALHEASIGSTPSAERSRAEVYDEVRKMVEPAE